VSGLPPALTAAIVRLLEGTPRKGLAERAAATSQAYRAGRGSAGVIREADDALAYALTRLPATFAACAAAFAETARAAPAFQPRSLLDAGVGPGAASWAALETWPRIARATWLDASPPFLALAGTLAADGPKALRDAEARRADLTTAEPAPKAELVVASYALAEIAADRQDAVVEALWAACDGVLALIEPGTTAGFQRLLAARAALIATGATILAPCPHALACPLGPPDWCHFSVRLPRSREHRLAKSAAVPFEDEKFAYLAAARPSVAAAASAPRILAQPRTGKPGIDLKLCQPDGTMAHRLVTKRDKPAYARARRLGWGDSWNGD
jgi:ribosomal protein RSM22 (predicted rRNA methylase)